MRVCVVLEHRFLRTPDGCVWTLSAFPYSFFRNYLDVFDEVRVVARVRDVAESPPNSRRSDGLNVSFLAMPYYVGPREYMQRWWALRQQARQILPEHGAIVFRVGSQLAALLEPQLRREQRPYAVEVGTDPYEGFAPGCVRHPLRPFFRWYFQRQQRRQCRNACAACYVTEFTLQQRYPPAAGAFFIGCSDVELPDEAFARAPRTAVPERMGLRVVTVGSLEQLYKGPDVLIDAARQCLRRGARLDVVFIGDGKHRPELEESARDLGVHVRFAGQLPSGQSVRDELDRADLFVLPSRSEGLPRALVEAMARGLPCLGSRVGGIPELLAPTDLLPPGDASALAKRLFDVTSHPEQCVQMAKRCWDRAQDFRSDALRGRRRAFLLHVRKATERWHGTRRLLAGAR